MSWKRSKDAQKRVEAIKAARGEVSPIDIESAVHSLNARMRALAKKGGGRPRPRNLPGLRDYNKIIFTQCALCGRRIMVRIWQTSNYVECDDGTLLDLCGDEFNGVPIVYHPKDYHRGF